MTYKILSMSCMILTSVVSNLMGGGQQSSLMPFPVPLVRGIALFNDEDYEAALPLLLQAYEESDKESISVRAISAHYLGVIYDKKMQKKEAVQFFLEAYSIGKVDPGHIELAAESACYLSMIYADGGAGIDQDFDKAFFYLNEAAGLVKRIAKQSCKKTLQKDRRYILGVVWQQALEKSKDGKHQQACELFKKIYENSKNDLEVHASVTQKLGEIYILGLGVQKDSKMALDYFTKAYKLGFNKELVTAYLGHVYLLDGDIARARTYYEQAYAFTSSPEYPKVLANLGFIYFDIDKDYQKALPYFYEAYQLSSGADRFTALYNLYAVQGFLLNKFDEMLQELKSNPTQTSIEWAKEVLDEAAAIKFIGSELNNQIKERYEQFNEVKKQWQTQQERPTQANPERIGSAQKKKLDELTKKNKIDKLASLLKEFERLFDIYKKQSVVSDVQCESARKILLEARLAILDNATALLVKDKFDELAREHAKKQQRVRELQDEKKDR